MENIAQWAAGAVAIGLVLWLIAKLRSHRRAWEQSERERLAIEAETKYWRERADEATRLAKHLDMLGQDIQAVPSRREYQNQLYEHAKAKALSRRMSDHLDNGAGVPLDTADIGKEQ